MQNIEIYKLLLNLLKIKHDSVNLNSTVMPQQFTEWGKFSSLLKNPTHKPISSKTDYHRKCHNILFSFKLKLFVKFKKRYRQVILIIYNSRLKYRPMLGENQKESNFDIKNNEIVDLRINNSFPIFMTRDRVLNYDWDGDDLEPFWWASMTRMLEKIKVDDEKNEFN